MTTKITEKNISSLANAGVNWQSVVVADGSTGLTAVAGRGYFIDTTSGTQTITLPTSPNIGDVVVLKDYARTWGTNNVTIASTLLDGATTSTTFSTSGQTVTLVRMDDTKGWSLVNEDTTTNLFPAVFLSATGGTVTTDGNFKIHTFTGDGCFVVATVGNSPTNPLGGPANVDYLVVAGGGGGGAGIGGGGGAGGFREGRVLPAPESYTASPLVAPAGLPVSATTYPVTVGAGGVGTGTPGVEISPVPAAPASTSGSNSSFSTITSTGGGYGRHYATQPTPSQAGPGGSGGGGSGNSAGTGGTGNTPPTSPSQGNTGGDGNPSNPWSSGGGGGATATGSDWNPSGSGPGGAGATTSISASPVAYAGGGGGGGSGYGNPAGGTGGSGVGGNGGPGSNSTGATTGTTNRGGGGGGGQQDCVQRGGANGGKGIVVIRYKFQ